MRVGVQRPIYVRRRRWRSGGRPAARLGLFVLLTITGCTSGMRVTALPSVPPSVSPIGGTASPSADPTAALSQADDQTATSPPLTLTSEAVYVSPNGSDDNPGTLDQPWRTLQYAVDQVGPGATVYVRAGLYAESVHIHRSGEEGRPITLMPFEGEPVTINGGAFPALADMTGTQYWAIEGFTLQSEAEHTLWLDAWGCDGTCGGTHHWRISGNRILGAVKIYGSYNVFEGNEVDGSQQLGAEDGVWELYDASHHNVFRGNHIHHFASRGLWSMHRTHDSLIEGNTIHDIGANPEQGMCIDADGYGTLEWRHVIRGNHLYRCGEAGIELENTFDAVVENNLIHDTGRRAIDVINYGRNLPRRADPPWPEGARCQVGGENNQYGDTDGDNDCEGDLTGNVIRQNLIYGGAYWGGIILFHAGGVWIGGNTVYGTQGPAILLDGGAQFCPQVELRGNLLTHSPVAVSLVDLASLVVDDHNLLHPLDPGAAYELREAQQSFSLVDYQVMTGLGQGSIQSDPLLVDPAGGDFSLRPGSPAIGAGVDIGLDTDLGGVQRPQGGGYDIGAYEFIPSDG